MSSAKPNTAFFVPSVEEPGDRESRLADIAGKVLHLYDEFHLTFAVAEERADEVSQPVFCRIKLAGQESCSPFLCTSRETVEQVEPEDFALHQVTVKHRFPYAEHFDVTF